MFRSLTLAVSMTWLWTRTGSPFPSNKTSCFWPTSSPSCLTQLNLRLSPSFTGLLLAMKYSSRAVQTVSSNISHQTWKSSSDWKITQWSPQSNYAGLVYDLSAQIHHPQLQKGEQPFNFSFQLAHHFPDQVVMNKLFTFSLFSSFFWNHEPHNFSVSYSLWEAPFSCLWTQFNYEDYRPRNLSGATVERIMGVTSSVIVKVGLVIWWWTMVTGGEAMCFQFSRVFNRYFTEVTAKWRSGTRHTVDSQAN